jgi:Sugar diacid utilization regulator
MAYQKLFIALQKGGLSQIAQIAYELLQRPIIIVNAELKKLVQYPNKPLGDPIWDVYLDESAMTPQMMWQLIDDSIIRQSENSQIPFWANWGLVENIPRLVGNVKINGVIEGYVGVLFQQKDYTDLHVKITQLVCQAVALEMQKQARSESSRYAMVEAFISDLFQEKIGTREELARWKKSFNIIMAPYFCIAVVEGDEWEKTTLYYLRNLVETSGKNIYCTVLENRLYILFVEIGRNLTLEDFTETRARKITDILNMYNLSAGISDNFDELIDLGKYKYQAEQALKVGRRCIPGLNLYSYREFILENMMFCVRENIEPQNYLHPAIEMLHLHDRKNGTEYLQTLRVYITSMCSHARTIKKLHIHRNTLLYRVKKIEEITGISLDNERVCALLLCNFYLLEERGF